MANPICLTTARRSRAIAAARQQIDHPRLSAIMRIDCALAELEAALHSLRGTRGFRSRDPHFLGAERELTREITGLEAKRAALCGVKAVRLVRGGKRG